LDFFSRLVNETAFCLFVCVFENELFVSNTGMVCAPEMSAKTPQGRSLGNVKFDFSCLQTILQCKLRWRAEDGNGTPQFVLQDNWCCTNCFAPSCCCPVHQIKIKTAVRFSYIQNINRYNV
jgi:hypothetical protein